MLLLLTAASPYNKQDFQDWQKKIDTTVKKFETEHLPDYAQPFGHFVVQVARQDMGAAYVTKSGMTDAGPIVPEIIQQSMNQFDCVTFVESSLSLSRCLWQRQYTATCFFKELENIRYRHGHLNGFASKLHYFEDWLIDNDTRNNIHIITQQLGGTIYPFQFSFMSTHPTYYAQMREFDTRVSIAHAEQNLSHTPQWIISTKHVSHIIDALQDGDIIAMVTPKPGLLINHVGFAAHHTNGSVYFLNASRWIQQEVIESTLLEDYIVHGPQHTKRLGIMVARPMIDKK